MTVPFQEYARYYDAFYGDKDYEGESQYLQAIFDRCQVRPTQSVIDIGCGTARHASYLQKMGFKVAGIDLSAEMIEIAKRRTSGISLQVASAQGFHLSNRFDAAISLFHVFNYQTSDESITNALKNIQSHLNADGLLVFDFWYGPAVQKQLPEVRTKEVETADALVKRTAQPQMDAKNRMVSIHYDIEIVDKKNLKRTRFGETHRMRYLFEPELTDFLIQNDFEPLHLWEWRQFDRAPTQESWSAVMVAKRK